MPQATTTGISVPIIDGSTVPTSNGVNTATYDQPDVKPGMIPELKNLYQSKPDDSGCRQWITAYPDDLETPAEDAETTRFALLVRNIKCYDGRRKLQIESIIIQSPLLRDALGSVLNDYPGITTGLDRMTFHPPFEPFVHRWSKLRAAIDGAEGESKAHLTLLYQILEEELRDSIKARDDLIAHQVITFDHVWMLFEPSSIVYSTRNGEPCAARLNFGNHGRNDCGRYYGLDCQHVDWDGEQFGHGSTFLQISEFQGTRKINSLSVFPMVYHPNEQAIKSTLLARGKEFERLSGYHYKAYQGIAVGQGLWGQMRYNVNSRIIIDTYAWNRFQPNEQVSLNSFPKTTQPSRAVVTDDEDSDDGNGYTPDSEDELQGSADFLEPKKKSRIMPLTQEQLLLCTNTLKGYSLKDKKWLTLFIGAVKEIRWNEHAFESLVLPDDQKELILALTESQRDHKNAFDDIIQGKGMGMIMLLSGKPGVGKTLTAESVAENMKAPLYMMSAGDLGLRASDVEQNLSNVLEMCTKWNAILLLDEADVFLEQRSAHDLERNKLVSIFLRILEYYEGILFLTTNRAADIDPAFQSRIHISMEYHDLTPASRRHVWATFLAAAPRGHDVSAEQMDRLAAVVMNGREIKNVVKTALLLASRKGTRLAFGHVSTVLSVEKRYQERGGDRFAKETVV